MKKLYFILLTSILFQSCIENDLPYPKVLGEILFIEIEGQTETAEILPEEQKVNIKVDVQSDLSNLSIDSLVITEGASVSPNPGSIVDFTNNVNLTISTYQDYEWTINVEKKIQDIEVELFKIEGQITSQVNNESQIISVIMPVDSDLSNLTVSEFVYQPSQYTVSPNYQEVHNFEDTVQFTFEDSILYKVVVSIEDAMFTSFSIEGQITSNIDYSTKRIEVLMPSYYDLSNLSIEEFEYHPEDAKVVPNREVTDFSEDVVFTFNDEIEWTVTVSKEEVDEEQVLFSDFTKWFRVGDSERESYFLPGENMDSPWRSGDKGASEVNLPTYPKTALPYPSLTNSEGAILETKTVTFLKILAAGSLFLGETEGSGIDNVVSDFGTEFTGRPTSFTTNFKYSPEIYGGNTIDECDIYVILQVREGEGDNEKRYRLATAWYRSDEHIDEFTDLTLPLKYGELSDVPSFMEPSLENNEMPEIGYYNDPNAKPTHIIMVFASSAHGASFQGAEGSTLIVKGISLNYE